MTLFVNNRMDLIKQYHLLHVMILYGVMCGMFHGRLYAIFLCHLQAVISMVHELEFAKNFKIKPNTLAR